MRYSRTRQSATGELSRAGGAPGRESERENVWTRKSPRAPGPPRPDSPRDKFLNLVEVNLDFWMKRS